MLLIPRMQLVCFSLNLTGETKFPDVKNIMPPNVRILGLCAYDVTMLTNASPSGQAVVSAAESLRLTVTLKSASDQRIQDVPYFDFKRASNGGIYYALAPVPIDWQQSIVKNNGAALATPVSAAFNVFYDYLD